MTHLSDSLQYIWPTLVIYKQQLLCKVLLGACSNMLMACFIHSDTFFQTFVVLQKISSVFSTIKRIPFCQHEWVNCFPFLCRVLLWAPFLNFRKFPRDPSLKYPWSTPEDPSKIRNAYPKYPFAEPEDYQWNCIHNTRNQVGHFGMKLYFQTIVGKRVIQPLPIVPFHLMIREYIEWDTVTNCNTFSLFSNLSMTREY